MFIKSAVVFATLLVGSLALPWIEPVEDVSQFFVHANENARIVGGTVAAEGSVPYMAALSSGWLIRSFMCGGSIISSRTILTAAHCIDAVFSAGSLSRYLRINVGSNRHNFGGVSYTLSRNVTHQHYVVNTLKNDIGLLITTNDIAFSSVVSPIPLSFEFVFGGVTARAAGWGRVGQNQAISSQLLELTVNIIDGQQCIDDMWMAGIANGFMPPPIEPHIEICTFHSRGHGMCNGDSGSALELGGQQVGVVSWGIPCARGGPDVFVRVSAFENWFNENVV